MRPRSPLSRWLQTSTLGSRRASRLRGALQRGGAYEICAHLHEELGAGFQKSLEGTHDRRAPGSSSTPKMRLRSARWYQEPARHLFVPMRSSSRRSSKMCLLPCIGGSGTSSTHDMFSSSCIGWRIIEEAMSQARVSACPARERPCSMRARAHWWKIPPTSCAVEVTRAAALLLRCPPFVERGAIVYQVRRTPVFTIVATTYGRGVVVLRENTRGW